MLSYPQSGGEEFRGGQQLRSQDPAPARPCAENQTPGAGKGWGRGDRNREGEVGEKASELLFVCLYLTYDRCTSTC